MGLFADIHSIAESLKRMAAHFDLVDAHTMIVSGNRKFDLAKLESVTEPASPVEFFEYDTEKHYEWEQEQLRKRAANPLEQADELEEL